LAFFRSEDGASFAEYALLVGLLAVLCVAAMSALGISIRDFFLGLSV
jgi:Flp pilus assembly pilin Flp